MDARVVVAHAPRDVGIAVAVARGLAERGVYAWFHARDVLTTDDVADAQQAAIGPAAVVVALVPPEPEEPDPLVRQAIACVSAGQVCLTFPVRPPTSAPGDGPTAAPLSHDPAIVAAIVTSVAEALDLPPAPSTGQMPVQRPKPAPPSEAPAVVAAADPAGARAASAPAATDPGPAARPGSTVVAPAPAAPGAASPPARKAAGSPRLVWAIVAATAIVAALAIGWALAGHHRRASGTGSDLPSSRAGRDGGASTRPSSANAPAVDVAITGLRSSAGWMLTIHFRDKEEPRSIRYRVGGRGPFLPTGSNPHDLDPASFEPRAQRTFVVERVPGPTTIEVAYVDARGEPKGPFSIVFDPVAESIKNLQHELETMPRWVEIHPGAGGKLNVYFSTLLVQKQAISAIRYGADTTTPSRKVRFLQSDELGVGKDDQLYATVPRSTSYVSVEVEFRDGTRSAIKRFSTR